jgi:RNA polymerase sigma-70 factor, ECF subfamily
MTAIVSRKALPVLNRVYNRSASGAAPDPRSRMRRHHVDKAVWQQLRRIQIRREFEELIPRAMPQLEAVANHILRNREDAEDAVQNTLASAHVSLDRFEGDSSLETWVYRILVNACLMKIRSRRSQRSASFTDLEFSEEQVPANNSRRNEERPGDRVEKAELISRVRDGVHRLPDVFRQVVELRDLDGLETDEAARMLGVSQGAVRTRLHRARQALRERLESSGLGM